MRRDTLTKEHCSIDKVAERIKVLILEFKKNLYNSAKKNLDSRIIEVNDLENFKKAIDQKKMIVAP